MMEFIAPMVVVTTLILTAGTTLVLRGPLGRALADRLFAEWKRTGLGFVTSTYCD